MTRPARVRVKQDVDLHSWRWDCAECLSRGFLDLQQDACAFARHHARTCPALRAAHLTRIIRTAHALACRTDAHISVIEALEAGLNPRREQ